MVELKLAGIISDGDVKRLKRLEEKLGDRVLDRIVLTTGSQAYRREGAIAVIPRALLGP